MKKFNLFNQFNRTFLLLVAVIAMSGNVWGSYEAKVTANSNPTGKGYVYVGTDNSYTGTPSLDSDKATTDLGKGDSHTFYLYAKEGTGYSFTNWTGVTETSFTSATKYGAAYTVTLPSAKKKEWVVNANFTANTYYVKFNGNGNTGGSTAQQTFTYDAAQDLTANGFTRAYKVTFNGNGGSTPTAQTATYTFKNWNTNSGGTGTTYTNGQSVSNLTATSGGTYNLYAQWNSASITLPNSTWADHVIEGWYNGSTKVGMPGDSYTPTSVVTLTAHWIAKYTPAYTYSGSNSYNVGDGPIDLKTLWTSTSDGAITYSKVSFTAASGEQSGSTEPAISDNRYLSLNKAGTLKIHLEQVETSTYYAGSADLTITISRCSNTITTSYASTMYMGATQTVSVSANNPGTISVSQTAGSDIATLNSAKTQVTSYANTGTATWTFSQAQTYKYNAASATMSITVKPAAATECVTYNIGKVDISAGEHDEVHDMVNSEKITFSTRIGGSSYNNTFWVDLYINNAWVNIFETSSEQAWTLTDSRIKSATKVRFSAKGTLNKYFDDVVIYRNKYVTLPSSVTVDKTSAGNPIYVGGQGVGTMTVNWSFCNGGQLRLSSSNPHFTVPATVDGATDGTGSSKDITITYSPVSAGTETADIVVYNDVYREVCHVTGVANQIFYATTYAEARPKVDGIGRIYVSVRGNQPQGDEGWTSSGNTDVSENSEEAGTSSTGSANINAVYYAEAFAGYHFDGWFEDEACTQSAGSYDPNDRNKYTKVVTTSATSRPGVQLYRYAKISPNTYTVTLDRQSGTGGTGSVTATYAADMPEATAPTRDGYTFHGYFDAANGEGTKYYNADMSSARTWNKTSNTTLYAYWTVNDYQVNYNLNYTGANQTNLFTGWTGTITSNGVSQAYDPATGYITLNGTSTSSTGAIVQKMPGVTTGDVVSFAATDCSGTRSSQNGCQVFELCNSTGSTPTTRQKIDFRTTASLSNQTVVEGYDYDKFWIWKDAENITFTDLKFKIRLEKAAALASKAAPSGKYVTYGDTYGTLANAPVREGYRFDGWYTAATGGTKVESTTQFTGTDNQVLYAHWTQIWYSQAVAIVPSQGCVGVYVTSSSGTTYNQIEQYNYWKTTSDSTNTLGLTATGDTTYYFFAKADEGSSFLGWSLTEGGAIISGSAPGADKRWANATKVTRTNTTYDDPQIFAYYPVYKNDVPVFKPQGFAAGVDNPAKVDDTFTLTVKNVSDGLTGNFKATYNASEFTVTRSGNEITIKTIKAGTYTVTFTQTQTADIQAATVSYTFVVTKYDVTFTWDGITTARTINSSFATSFSSTNPGTINVNNKTSNIAEYKNGTVYVYNTPGTATINLSQEATYKYNAKSQDYSFTVSKPNDHLDMLINSWGSHSAYHGAAQHFNIYDDGRLVFKDDGTSTVRYTEYTFTGVPDSIFFTASTDATTNKPTFTWKYKTSTSDWQGIDSKQTRDDFNAKNAVNHDAVAIRLEYTGAANAGYVSNLRVTEWHKFDATPTSLAFGSHKLNEPGVSPQTVTLSYATVGYKVQATTNDPQFTVTPELITNIGGDKYGTVNFTVGYKTDALHTSNNAKLILSDENGNSKEIALSGTTHEGYAPTFNHSALAARNNYVGESNINLASLWTSNNSHSAITYSVVSFTQDGGSHDGFSGNPYTLNGSTLSINKAGTLVLRASQPEDAWFKGGSDEVSITVKRNANPVTFTVDGNTATSATFGYNTTHTMTYSTVNSGSSTIAPAAGNEYVARSGNTLTTNYREGNVTFTVSQAQNYKYEAASNNTITINVTSVVSQCMIPVSNPDSETKIGDYGIQSWSGGGGGTLTFTARTEGTFLYSSTIRVQEKVNGQWNLKYTTPEMTTSDKEYTCTLSPQSTAFQFVSDHDYHIYVHNVTLTRASYLTPAESTVTMTKIKGEEAITHDIKVAYSSCEENNNIQVLNDNETWFTVTPKTTFSGLAGEQTFTITYNKCTTVANHTANITFYTQGFKQVVTVNGVTQDVQNPTWTCNINSAYNVEEATLDLQALWTSNNTYASSPRQYSIVFTPDAGSHDGATGVTLSSNRYLTLGDAGTVAITMSQAANEFYYAKTETKTVTLNRLANSVTYSMYDLVQGASVRDNLLLYLGDYGTITINPTHTTVPFTVEQTNQFKSCTLYPNGESTDWLVYASATVSDGNVNFTVNQPQTYKYEAVNSSFYARVQEMTEADCYALNSTSVSLTADGYTSSLHIIGEPSQLTYTLNTTNLGSGDTTLCWMEYTLSATGTEGWMVYGTKAVPATGAKTITDLPKNVQYIRFGVEKIASGAQLNFNNVTAPRARYVKVGQTTATLKEDDLHFPAEVVHLGDSTQHTFEVAYSICDMSNNLHIQCNKGAAAKFNITDLPLSDDNPSQQHQISMSYTPSAVGKDTVIVAIYNRSLRRRVFLYVDIKPFTLLGGDWNNAENWDGGKKPATVDMAYIAGDATVSTNETIKSVLIAENKTLTINHNAALTLTQADALPVTATSFGKLAVLADGQLNVDGGTFHVDSLALYGGYYNTNVFGVPYLYIDDEASINTTAQEIDYVYSTDYTCYHPLAVPFQANLTDLRYLTKPNTSTAKIIGEGKAIDIRTYDGEQRAKDNKSLHTKSIYWKSVTATDVLQPGTGYIIAAKKLKGEEFATLVFKMHVDNKWLTNGEQVTIDNTYYRNKTNVGAWGMDIDTVRWNNKGWNFVASPYLSKKSTSDDPMIYIQDSVGDWGGYEPNKDSIKYITIPSGKMDDYYQTPVELGEGLNPYWSVFIQAKISGDLVFNNTRVRETASPERRAFMAAEQPVSEQRAYISISGNHETDLMGMLISEKYSPEYELNADLLKMMGEASTLRAYLNYNEMDLAYMATDSASAAQTIPLTVRIPAQGTYTFSMHKASRTDGLEAIYLTDFLSDRYINLLEQNYEFYAEPGSFNNRFALNVVAATKTTPTGLTGTNDENNTIKKIMYNNRLYIISDDRIYDGQGQRVNSFTIK